MYADFQSSDLYTSKVAGAALEIHLVNADDPTDVVIGAVSSFNCDDDFEQSPVEEAGNEGVDEFVSGRHSGNGSTTAFFTPEWNDRLPTRSTFIGKTYTILRRFGEAHGNANGHTFAETVLDVLTGAKISRIGSQQSARGTVTLNLSFVYENHYNGAEWSALSGT